MEKNNFVIYSRDNCSFCNRAVELAKQLQGHGYGEYPYVDIIAEGIDKQKLSDMVGKLVETIPHVFLDDVPTGGYTEFAAFASTL
ncbi:TPA: GrxA family glutaredoxin [Raoultella planticola]|uniref:GrxA family glutaredoxin n=1 Tax=Raoultella TaxID=160674 RepID=UPI0027EE3A55|nr:GrxA family glutaredoxin [Hafnia alvei]HBU6972925.1 GrxA family glutaredoxin [Raoultella planticola]HDT5988113.1 GrxA family glutaredoxin [Raoultella planticola]HDT6038856.1 GrxA family glutaredoxin [Raoultella planticola]HDT6047789.1 GrxA family glutaredoxin [Raoultella planticola]